MLSNNFPSFSENEIEVAKRILSGYGDDKACSNNVIFGEGISSTYRNKNYSEMSLKRSYLRKALVEACDFTGSALTGSRFIETEFNDCIFADANMQDIDFIESTFFNTGNTVYSTTNFSNSSFINTKFKNVEFRACTIYNTLFEKCSFSDSKICITTLEGSKFERCEFLNVDMSNLNIDFVTFLDPKMHNVLLPFYQAPYVINGLQYLMSTHDEVHIHSQRSKNGSITLDEYIHLWDYLCAYYFGLKEFFPMASIYLAKGETETAFYCIFEGIKRSCRISDFRMVKHFCKLLTSTPEFGIDHIKKIHSYVQNYFDPGKISNREFHGYLKNIGDIRSILLDGDYNLQTLEILIQTNINSTDTKMISEFIAELSRFIDEYSGNSRSKFIELRHNSDFTILINLVNGLESLLPFIIYLYDMFGVVDKVFKFYDTLLSIQKKQNEKKERKNKILSDNKYSLGIKNNDADKLKLEMTYLKKELRNTKATNKKFEDEVKYLRGQNILLADRVVEMTHIITGFSGKVLDNELVYSKTQF